MQPVVKRFMYAFVRKGGNWVILGKKKRIGKTVEEIEVGEKLKLTEKIEDKNILLYLGLTNDGNPLYIQQDYASRTIYEKPIVPTIMLAGIVTSAISKYLPGSGSHVTEQHLFFPNPAYHYATIEFSFEVIEINANENSIVLDVLATNENEDTVVTGTVKVSPPQIVGKMDQ